SPTGSQQNAPATPSSPPSTTTESNSPAPASTADTHKSGSPAHTYPPDRATRRLTTRMVCPFRMHYVALDGDDRTHSAMNVRTLFKLMSRRSAMQESSR